MSHSPKITLIDFDIFDIEFLHFITYPFYRFFNSPICYFSTKRVYGLEVIIFLIFYMLWWRVDIEEAVVYIDCFWQSSSIRRLLLLKLAKLIITFRTNSPLGSMQSFICFETTPVTNFILLIFYRSSFLCASLFFNVIFINLNLISNNVHYIYIFHIHFIINYILLKFNIISKNFTFYYILSYLNCINIIFMANYSN
jgi:hypothetical protein